MILKTNPAFRYLFISRILCVFSDSIIFFSLLKWIEMKSAGSGAYTWFFVAYYLPITMLALPIGAWISNKTLQKAMTYSNLIRAIILLLFLLAMPFINYYWAYLLLILMSILGLFFIPANQTLLPSIVEDTHRPVANSLLQMGFTVVKIVGQVFTASMIKLSMSICSLLFVATLFLLLSILCIRKIKPVIKHESKEGENQWHLMKEGIAYIFYHQKLKPLFLFLSIAMFIATAVDLLLISFLTNILKVGVENLSFIGAASLLGITTGAVITPKWYKILERKWLIIPPLFTLSISIGSLFFITNWLYILPLFFLQGIALGCFNITFLTYLQDVVAKENYTRTFSLYNMIISSMALPGVLLIGGLLSRIGVIHTILIVAGAMFLIGIAGMYYLPALGKGFPTEESNVGAQ